MSPAAAEQTPLKKEAKRTIEWQYRAECAEREVKRVRESLRIAEAKLVKVQDWAAWFPEFTYWGVKSEVLAILDGEEK